MAATDQKIESQNKFYGDLKVDIKDLKDAAEKNSEETRKSLEKIVNKINDLSGKTILNSAAVGIASSVFIAVIAGLLIKC